MPRKGIHFPPKDAALRDDVHALGHLVGEVLKEQCGEALFDAVEGDRQAAIGRREGDADDSEALVVRTQGRPPDEALELIRAFATWFQVVNMAEKVHRVRRRRQYVNADAGPQPGGLQDCFARLKEHGLTLEQTLALLGQLRVEPVFAAHPTESTRRTLLRQQQRVARLLMSQARACADGRRERGHHRPRPHRAHDRLADGGQFPRAPDGGGRTRARSLLPRRGHLQGHPVLLRADRGGARPRIRR